MQPRRLNRDKAIYTNTTLNWNRYQDLKQTMQREITKIKQSTPDMVNAKILQAP